MRIFFFFLRRNHFPNITKGCAEIFQLPAAISTLKCRKAYITFMVQITFKLTTFWLHLGNQMKFCILSKPLISVVPLNNMAFLLLLFFHSSCPYRFPPMGMMSFIHVFEPRMDFFVTVCHNDMQTGTVENGMPNSRMNYFFFSCFFTCNATNIFSLFLSKPQDSNWSNFSMQKSYGVEWKKNSFVHTCSRYFINK